MRKATYSAITVLIIGLCLFSVERLSYGQDQESYDVVQELHKTRSILDRVDNYTAIFVKEEMIKGKMKKPETIQMKFKKPFQVYMKWIKNPHKGRELIYVQGKNDDKLKVHIGGILNLFLPAINLSPDDRNVKDNTRHSIRSAGLHNLMTSLIQQFELAAENGHLKTEYHGIEKIGKRDTHKVERILQPDEGYYCYRLILNVDKDTGLPVRIQVFDWDNTLVERFTYKNIDLSTSLTDEDFNPRNKNYAFGIF